MGELLKDLAIIKSKCAIYIPTLVVKFMKFEMYWNGLVHKHIFSISTYLNNKKIISRLDCDLDFLLDTNDYQPF